MLTTNMLIRSLIDIKKKYPSINSNALVIGNDINSAKAIADQFSRVIMVDTAVSPNDYVKINDFPNITLIKSPIDFATRSFPNNFFGIIFIADPKSLDVLRFLVNSTSNFVQGVHLVPEDPCIDVSELNSEYEGGIYVIKA